MNLHDKSLGDKKITAPEVTTGPLAGSRKVYSSPEGHEDLRVPLRGRSNAQTNGGAILQRLRLLGAVHRHRRQPST